MLAKVHGCAWIDFCTACTFVSLLDESLIVRKNCVFHLPQKSGFGAWNDVICELAMLCL